MTTFTMQRFGKRPPERPSLEPFAECRDADTNTARPFPDIHRLTLECYRSANSRVANLLGLSGPAAVPRFIIPVVVYTVNRVLRCGLFAHISEEVREVPPPLTHNYSAPAVVLVLLRVWVSATLDHANPRITFSLIISTRVIRVGVMLLMHRLFSLTVESWRRAAGWFRPSQRHVCMAIIS